MGRSLHDRVRASSAREHYTNPIRSAVRAMEPALNFQADADLCFHRMVQGRSTKKLEKLDRELELMSVVETHFPAEAYREVQKRLRKFIKDRKAIEKELRLIGQKKGA